MGLVGKIFEVKEGNTLIPLHLQRENVLSNCLSSGISGVAPFQIHNLNFQPLPMTLLSKGFPFHKRSPQQDESYVQDSRKAKNTALT